MRFTLSGASGVLLALTVTFSWSSPPQVLWLLPADDAVLVHRESPLQIALDQPVVLQSGSVRLYRESDMSLVDSIPAESLLVQNQAATLFGFESGREAWFYFTGQFPLNPMVQTDSLAYKGLFSVKATLPTVSSIQVSLGSKDWSRYDSVALYVRTNQATRQCRIFVQSGVSALYSYGSNQVLPVNTWHRFKLDLKTVDSPQSIQVLGIELSAGSYLIDHVELYGDSLSQITIPRLNPLDSAETYFVEIDVGTWENGQNEPFAGFMGSSHWRFSTDSLALVHRNSKPVPAQTHIPIWISSPQLTTAKSSQMTLHTPLTLPFASHTQIRIPYTDKDRDSIWFTMYGDTTGITLSQQDTTAILTVMGLAPGAYIFGLCAQDTLGAADTLQIHIFVEHNRPPIVEVGSLQFMNRDKGTIQSFTYPFNSPVSESQALSFTLNINDPERDSIDLILDSNSMPLHWKQYGNIFLMTIDSIQAHDTLISLRVYDQASNFVQITQAIQWIPSLFNPRIQHQNFSIRRNVQGAVVQSTFICLLHNDLCYISDSNYPITRVYDQTP